MPRAPSGRLWTLGDGLLDGQIAGRDRIAVGIVGRIPELGRDQLLELFREHMLEHLGLVVHAIPGHPQALDQVQLEQPVMANHLERNPLTGLGQGDPAVGLMGDQSELSETLDHARSRRRRDTEAVSEGISAHRPIAPSLKRVDRLAVVLNRGGTQRALFLECGHYKLWYA